MEELPVTENLVYYIYKYRPKWTWKFHDYSFKETEITRKIWRYRDMNEDAVNFFTLELLKAISSLIEMKTPLFNADTVGLVAVPPSKVNKVSPVEESIQRIYYGYHEMTMKIHFLDTICDCSDLLVRTKDIETQHTGHRASAEQQYESIACRHDNLSEACDAYILLDDVTTSGNSMKVCKQILEEHGARNVYRLAIARTV